MYRNCSKWAPFYFLVFVLIDLVVFISAGLIDCRFDWCLIDWNWLKSEAKGGNGNNIKFVSCLLFGAVLVFSAFFIFLSLWFFDVFVCVCVCVKKKQNFFGFSRQFGLLSALFVSEKAPSKRPLVAFEQTLIQNGVSFRGGYEESLQSGSESNATDPERQRQRQRQRHIQSPPSYLFFFMSHFCLSPFVFNVIIGWFLERKKIGPVVAKLIK